MSLQINMKCGDNVRNPFRRESRNIENPTYPITGTEVLKYLGGVPTLAGVDVNSETAERSLAVWRAVNLIAGTVASLPLKVYKDTPEGRREISNPLFLDPIYPDVTWYEGLETAVRHILLYGNCYFLKIRNEAGDRVVRLLPLPPTTVGVRRGKVTAYNESGKEFKVQGIDEVLTPNEVLHIPYISQDGLVGLSPIAIARNAIGINIAAEEVAAKLFDSGLLQGGILQAEGEITDKQAEEVKRRWMDKVSGQVRAYEINVLSKGFKFIPATIPPRDAQWIETRRFGVEEIARVFGMPADLLFENSATGNTNVEQRALSWVRFGLAPLLTRIEDKLSLHLLPRGTFCEFETVGLLRGDSLTEAEVMKMEIEMGILTVNEARAIKNRKPLPEPKALPVAPEPDPGPPAPEPRSLVVKRDNSGQIVGLVQETPVAEIEVKEEPPTLTATGETVTRLKESFRSTGEPVTHRATWDEEEEGSNESE